MGVRNVGKLTYVILALFLITIDSKLDQYFFLELCKPNRSRYFRRPAGENIIIRYAIYISDCY